MGDPGKKTHDLFTSLLHTGLALALCGCGSSSSENSSIEGDLGAYIEQSCQYSAEEGEKASFEPSSAPIVKGYFEKDYNRDWLRAVGHSSMRETLAFIEKTGARVYQANAKTQKSCKPFTFASAVPVDIANAWARAEQIVADQSLQTGSIGFIAGLYLPKSEHSVNQPSLKDQSAIVVRADASRWTLVHEFMHHNFKVQSIASGYRDDVVQERSLSLAARLSKGLNDPNLDELEKVKLLTPVFLQVAENGDRLVVEYPLEEIAIEAMLQDQVDSGELTFVPTTSYANASWYIQRSKATLDGLYRSMDDVYYELRDLAAKNRLWTEYNALSRYLELKSKRVAQLEVMLKKRLVTQHSDFIAGAQQGDEINSTPVMGIAPCGEAAAAYQVIDELAAQISKVRTGL